MSISPASFLYQEQGPVATITFDRPDRLNSLTFEVYRELTDTLAKLRTREQIRVVVITGRGRGFCSGGDVEDIIGELFSRDMNGLLEFTRMTCELIANIRSLHKPVIASLNGTVAGAGAVIALACDLRIAAVTAKIAFLFTKVGLAGADMGAGFLLPKVIGLSKATDWAVQQGCRSFRTRSRDVQMGPTACGGTWLCARYDKSGVESRAEPEHGRGSGG